MSRPDSEPTLAVLRFAQQQLGPHSETLLARPEIQVGVLSRIRAGASLEDAALAEVFRMSATDRRVADEFLAYFLADLMRVGDATLSPALRRFLDSGDLVQSVLGDVWTELAGMTFDTRGRFLAYLTNRMRWKAAGKHRGLRAHKRREDLRVDLDPADIDPSAQGPSPSAAARSAEERDQLILRLLRLSERDRDLLTRQLRGESLEQIAEALDLSPAAARKALQRASRRAREST